ncbi:hypothetical protein EB061_12765, partial [bacterium]|nr:hypothetical protein [bacterium]
TETFSTLHIADELTALLHSAVGPLAEGLKRWADIERDARRDLLGTIHANRSLHLGRLDSSDPLKSAFAELGWLA